MHISIAKDAKGEIQKHCHGGKGEIVFRELFKEKDFNSSLEFIHETLVLPNSSIGYHAHKGNEEIYYIIQGKGLMNVDGEKRVVRTGDAIITHSGNSHGLVNTQNKPLKILVFESKY